MEEQVEIAEQKLNVEKKNNSLLKQQVIIYSILF